MKQDDPNKEATFEQLLHTKMDRRSFLMKTGKGAVLLAGLGMIGSSPARRLLSSAIGTPTASAKGMELTIPALWWRQLSTTESGQLAYWDTAKLSSLGATWLSSSYRPLDENNKFVGTSWVIPPGMIERVMELAKPGLESAHRAGIKVVGTSDSMQFRPEVMVSVGIDPELLYGRDLNGAKVGIDAYQKGNFMSCLQNPYWQDIEAKIGKAHAEAGFDGIFLDLFPYTSGKGLLCGCDYCRTGWATYSANLFGGPQPFPTAAGVNLNGAVDRAFLRWRIEAIYNMMAKIDKAARPYNPEFKVSLNCNSDNPCMAYLLLLGMAQPTSELGQLSAGDDSSLYIYRVIESAGGDPQFAQFNGPNQYLPDYKYKVELAESYAGGGALMLAAKNNDMDEINRNFTDFLHANRTVYEGSRSDARVAILFSWRDHTFLQNSSMIKADRMVWTRNSARRTAAALASKGIPYDYVFIEKKLNLNILSNYDVIIAPDLKLLDEKDADFIRQYVEKGGRLLALGAFGTLYSSEEEYLQRETSLLTKWTGTEMENGYMEAQVGRGRIGASTAYVSGGSEAVMQIADGFNRAAAYVELDSQLQVKNNGNGCIESTIRMNGNEGKSERYIHLIRYRNKGDIGNKQAKLVYKIPDGLKVKQVSGVSPYCGSDEMGVVWNASGGSLSVDIDRLELYGIIKVVMER